MKTDELIVELSRDLRPVRRLPSPAGRTLCWLALALPVVALDIAINGFRPDLAHKLDEVRFLIEFVAAAATGILAAWAAFSSTVPGRCDRRLFLPLLPAAVWMAALGDGCWRDWLAIGTLFGPQAWHPQCMPEIIATSLVPSVALVVMARRGAPFRPTATAALAALAAASLAAAGMSLFHAIDASVAVLVWQFGTVALMAGVMGALGARLFGRRPVRS